MPPKKLTHQEKLDNAWKRIEARLEHRKDKFGVYTCKVITPGEGVVKNKHANTYKVSFGKEKKLAHRIAYEFFNDEIDSDLDVSHLCHNETCVEDTHLHQEDHATNMERIGCPGWLKPKGKNTLILACNHNPRCKKITEVQDKTVKLTKDLKPQDLE